MTMRILPGLDDRSIARGMALTTAWMRDWSFRAKFKLGVARFKLDASEQEFLHRIYSSQKLGKVLHWSNQHVRRAFTEALIEAFLDDAELNPERERWLATFAWDEGITLERTPSVDIVALKAKVDKAMRQYGLTGFGIVEVDTTTSIVGHGKLLLFHVHVYCWANEGVHFNKTTAAEELMATRRFRNRLNAPSVNFKVVSVYDLSVARIAGYLAKYQPGAKNRIERRKQPGRFSFRGTLVGLRPSSVVRLVEVMSHLDARDVVFSVGSGGRALRDAWYTKFMAVIRKLQPRSSQGKRREWDVDLEWRDIRKKNGSKRMKPCRIITRVDARYTWL